MATICESIGWPTANLMPLLRADSRRVSLNDNTRNIVSCLIRAARRVLLGAPLAAVRGRDAHTPARPSVRGRAWVAEFPGLVWGWGLPDGQAQKARPPPHDAPRTPLQSACRN